MSIIRKIIKTFSLIIFFPLLIPIKFCPYSFPWIACSGCSLLFCPAKRLRNPILCLIIPLIFVRGRLFCRFICPFGTIQDITNHTSRRISGQDVRLYSNPYIKYLFLVFVIILCFDLEGSFFPLSYYWFPFLLAIFLFLSSFTNRYWCRLLCPMGALFTIFRIKKE